MMKHLKKKDNYILNFDDNNNYMIKNIKLDKDYIIICIKYENIKKIIIFHIINLILKMVFTNILIQVIKK